MTAHRKPKAAAMPSIPIASNASGSSGANMRHATMSAYIISAPIALAATNAPLIARNIRTRFMKPILHGVAHDLAIR
jgi:hypothetical protein